MQEFHCEKFLYLLRHARYINYAKLLFFISFSYSFWIVITKLTHNKLEVSLHTFIVMFAILSHSFDLISNTKSTTWHSLCIEGSFKLTVKLKVFRNSLLHSLPFSRSNIITIKNTLNVFLHRILTKLLFQKSFNLEKAFKRNKL